MQKIRMQSHKKEIEKIISRIGCSKNFKCYKSGFKSIGKAEDVGIESFVKCLDKNAWQCEFSFAFGSSYFCQCPLRIYVLRELKR